MRKLPNGLPLPAVLLSVVRVQHGQPKPILAVPHLGEAGVAIVKPPPDSPPPAGSTRLPDLAPGSVARVVEIDALAGRWRERLQAYGLAPGREVKVIQHAPVTVVRVEHIDLAFESAIARGILVSEQI